MAVSKIITLMTIYILVQSQSEGSFKIQSVGYQSTENGSLPTFCFLDVTKSEPGGTYYFFEGSSGYYDGTICSINGTWSPEGGDLCHTLGIIKSVIWKSILQDVCVVLVTEGYEMQDSYLEGTAEHDSHCLPSSSSEYLDGATVFFQGSIGLVNNDTCWIKGSRLGRNQCYRQGYIGAYGTVKRACYLTNEFAYVLGTGFVRINKTIDLIAD